MVAAANPSAGPQVNISAGAPPVIFGTTTPPSINMQGSNPATINVGDTYTDLSQIVIDTSQVATDTWGNTSTSTRTVIIEAASSSSN